MTEDFLPKLFKRLRPRSESTESSLSISTASPGSTEAMYLILTTLGYEMYEQIFTPQSFQWVIGLDQKQITLRGHKLSEEAWNIELHLKDPTNLESPQSALRALLRIAQALRWEGIALPSPSSGRSG